MTDLILSSEKETMTSLEVAELTGKQHSHIMRDIRSLLDQGVHESNFGLMFKITKLGNGAEREDPYYILTKKGCLILASGYDAVLREKIIDRWEELENKNQLNHHFEIPQSFSEALKLAAIQAEEIEKQQKQLQEQAPKVLFASAIEGSKTSCLVGELAKLITQNGYNIGQNRLFKWMRDNKYMGKSGENYNIPYQQYVEQGLFELKKGVRSGNEGVMHTTVTPKVTGKGMRYFVNKFLNHEK